MVRPAPSAKRRCRHPTPRAMCPRSATRPSDTSVIAVAPASAATRPCPYGTFGHQMTRDASASRPATPLMQQRISRCRPAELTDDRHRVAGAGPVAGAPVRGPRRSPSAVTEITHCGAAHQITADDPGAQQPRASSHMPSASATASALLTYHLARRRRRRTRWARHPSPRCRPRSARSPCGRCRVAVDQSSRKCLSLDQHVGGHHDCGRRQRSRTAASSPGPTATAAGCRRSRHQPVDHGELAHLRQSRLGSSFSPTAPVSPLNTGRPAVRLVPAAQPSLCSGNGGDSGWSRPSC